MDGSDVTDRVCKHARNLPDHQNILYEKICFYVRPAGRDERPTKS